MRTIGYFAFLGAIATATSVLDAADPAYRFDKVAETGATYSSLGVPAVNDGGVVAFTAAATGGAVGLYYGTPQAVQQVTLPQGVTIFRGTAPITVDINNPGQIAFAASPGPVNDRVGVYRFNPGGSVDLANSATSPLSIRNPAINDSGLIAYIRQSSANTQDEFLTTTAVGGRSFGGAGVYGAHVNNDGQALATAAGGRLFLGDGSTTNPIVTPLFPTYTDPTTGATGTFSTTGNADAGDGRRAVFSARHAGNPAALFVWDDGAISKVPGSDGVDQLEVVPAINDLGRVAALLAGRLSYFDAAGEHRVISVGDALDGATVTGLAFNAEGFNDLGQLAFNATLADGRSVNVLATVPEPGAAVGILLAAGAAMLTRRRATRR